MTRILRARIAAFVGGGLVLAAAVCATILQNPAEMQRAVTTGQALIVSRFALTDHTGRAVTHRTYAGKWQLVFFGFTYCPDVCPTTLLAMTHVLDRLGPDSGKIVPLFITVDPTRDTPQVLREYLKAFHPSMIGLTGTDEQIRNAAHSFRVYFSRRSQTDAPSGYLMNHSGYIYLMRPDGSYEAHFSESDDPIERIVAAVKQRITK